jgi:hypothetical protein
MPARPYRATSCAVALVLAVSATACGASPDDEATAAQPTGTPSASASPAAAEPAPAGTWRAGPAPYAAVVTVLRDAGLGQWADVVLNGSEPTSQVTYDLKIQGGMVLLSSAVDDRPMDVQDREAYTVEGQTLTLKPLSASCASTFTWTVSGDQLAMRLSEDTCPDYQGTPDEAYMRALYTALPFRRVVG